MQTTRDRADDSALAARGCQAAAATDTANDEKPSPRPGIAAGDAPLPSLARDVPRLCELCGVAIAVAGLTVGMRSEGDQCL